MYVWTCSAYLNVCVGIVRIIFIVLYCGGRNTTNLSSVRLSLKFLLLGTVVVYIVPAVDMYV